PVGNGLRSQQAAPTSGMSGTAKSLMHTQNTPRGSSATIRYCALRASCSLWGWLRRKTSRRSMLPSAAKLIVPSRSPMRVHFPTSTWLWLTSGRSSIHEKKMNSVMTETTFGEAKIKAVGDLMRDDERVVIIGGAGFGGLLHAKHVKPLHDEFGPRILRTPIAELGFCGMGIGAATAGLSPRLSPLTPHSSRCSPPPITT